MRVLGINGSPQAENSQTATIMTSFLEGMEESGAEVELIYVYQLDIKPCLGCHSCWTKTPGECVLKDDMEDLYPRIAMADVIVLGTPVYFDGMTGAMKTMIERLLPFGELGVEIRKDRCRHLVRAHKKFEKLVLISTCGYPELTTFDPLVTYVKALCENFDCEFTGALLRPYPSLLSGLRQQNSLVDDVYEAAREAGQELGKTGKISAHTLARVSREFLSVDQYLAGV